MRIQHQGKCKRRAEKMRLTMERLMPNATNTSNIWTVTGFFPFIHFSFCSVCDLIDSMTVFKSSHFRYLSIALHGNVQIDFFPFIASTICIYFWSSPLSYKCNRCLLLHYNVNVVYFVRICMCSVFSLVIVFWCVETDNYEYVLVTEHVL